MVPNTYLHRRHAHCHSQLSLGVHGSRQRSRRAIYDLRTLARPRRPIDGTFLFPRFPHSVTRSAIADMLGSSQVVEDGYEFFAKRQLVTLFSAPNYCGEFDNAGAMMSVDETLLCSFQVRIITWLM